MAMVASNTHPLSPGPHHHHHHHHHHNHRHHLHQTANKLTRSLERILEEAHLSGELKLSGRKLKDFPVPCSNTTSVQNKFNLLDTVIADLSKNRFSELPIEVTEFCSLETLVLYHNAIRTVPDSVVYLQSLTYLDLSRNQLTMLPATLCQLPLEVLLVSNNKLVSLPDEIGLVKTLAELDASCNELNGLPIGLGELPALRALNVRRNRIAHLPVELTFLKLVRLDISCNRITRLPVELRRMNSLETLDLHHNPLTSPPADVCTRGRIHVFKYLETQDTSSKNSRTNDDLHPARRSTSNASSTSSALSGHRRIANHRTGITRYTVDSGYSTCDGLSQPDSRPSSTAEPEFGGVSRSIPIPVNGSNGGSGSSTPSTISPGDSTLTLEQELSKAMMLTDQLERRRAASSYEQNSGGGDLSPRLRVIHANSNGSPRYTPTKTSPLTNGGSEDEKKPLEHIQTYREYKEALRQQRSAFDVYRPRGTSSVTTPPFGDSPGTFQINGTMNGESEPNGRISNSPHHDALNRPSPTHPIQPPPPPPGQQTPLVNGNKMSNDYLRTNGLSYVKPSSPVRSSSLNETVGGVGGGGGGGNSATNNVRVLRASVGYIGNHSRRQWGDTPESPTPPPPDRFSFTMRREFDKAKEEAELVQQLRQHIETRLKMSLPDDMAPALTDGVVLCHLANHIRPRSVASIHVPSPAVPKLTMARCRRNVDNFLEACRRIGVEEKLVCCAADVLEGRGLVRVAITVSELMRYHQPRSPAHPTHPTQPTHSAHPTSSAAPA